MLLWEAYLGTPEAQHRPYQLLRVQGPSASLQRDQASESSRKRLLECLLLPATCSTRDSIKNRSAKCSVQVRSAVCHLPPLEVTVSRNKRCLC